MRRPRIVLLAGAALLSAACGGGAGEAPPDGSPAAAPPVAVAVTVAPLAWLADEVGGERVATTVMIPPGHEPHAYEPSPREMAALDRARVFVAVGHPLLATERRHLDPALAARPEIVVVRLAEAGEALPEPTPDDGEDHHGHGDDDPHLWLSPARMRAAAEELAGALARVDPAGAAGYRERLEAVRRRIGEVDREVAALVEGLPRRRFLVVHPAWGAFAEHYGIEQVAVEREGKEPGPRELAERIAAARAEGFATVFTQRGFADRPARVIADEIGARVVPLDPLARDWDDNLLAVARALHEELDRPAADAGPEPTR